MLVRYADDLVALCHSQARGARGQGAAGQRGWRPGVWPSTRTRRASSPSMRASTFWGYNVRRYRGKLLIKPSKAAIETDPGTAAHRDCGPCAGANVSRGAASGSTRSFGAGRPTTGERCPARCSHALDYHLWKLTYKWACFSHPNKPRYWIIARYFGAFNKSRRDRWVFGDRHSGAYLHKFAWTQDRPTPDGQGRGVPGRPRPGRLLGRPATQDNHPRRSARPACGSYEAQARPLPALRRLLPPRRRPAPKPHASGNTG